MELRQAILLMLLVHDFFKKNVHKKRTRMIQLSTIILGIGIILGNVNFEGFNAVRGGFRVSQVSRDD